MRLIGSGFKEHVGTVALLAVLSISLGANVVLVRRPAPAEGKRAGVSVSQFLPALPTVRLDGSEDVLELNGGQPTLLYVMSARCSWCVANRPNILQIASGLSGKVRIVGLSIDGEQEQWTKHEEGSPLPFEVRRLASPALRDPLGFNTTPQLILVNGRGMAEQVWVGALFGERQTEVERQLGVVLPGVPEAQLREGSEGRR